MKVRIDYQDRRFNLHRIPKGERWPGQTIELPAAVMRHYEQHRAQDEWWQGALAQLDHESREDDRTHGDDEREPETRDRWERTR